MKKLVLILLVAISFNAFAQEKLEEGILISKMTMSSDNEQMNAQLAMVGDVESTTYFKGLKSRNETSSPMTGEVITIADNEAKQIMVLMNNPMAGKMYSKSEIKDSEADLEGVTVKKGTETKTILGYDCDQYIVTMNQGGQSIEMTLFATKAIDAYSQQTASFAQKVDGFPLYLQMIMDQGGAKMTITNEVTDIKKESVSGDKFDMTPPEGYEERKQ